MGDAALDQGTNYRQYDGFWAALGPDVLQHWLDRTTPANKRNSDSGREGRGLRIVAPNEGRTVVYPQRA